MREQGQPTGVEPVEFDPLAPEAEGESGQPLGDWSELDWSASPPGAAEALAEDGLAEDDEPGDEDSAGRPARARRFRKTGGRRPRRGGRHQSEIGPAPGEDFGDEMEDDSESSAESYVPDPNDIVEPELQEEIRREAEEIEAMEIELGIRQPGEIRESLRGGRGPFKPPIQEIFQRNDEVLVQVIKESLGTKGPTLSTYISIPGRYLVLMPGLQRVGVSRKIGDDSQRRKLRDKMNALNPPKGLGFIVRTAGVDRSKRELARDLAYLLRLWKTILRRIKRTRSPAPIYQESDMIIRTIRDIFTGEIDTIWIDEQSAFERAQEFLKNVMPKYVDRLKLYGDRTPLFHKYGIEDEIARIGQRHVPLPDGGSIVIDQTEALVAIDVNSGSFRADDDAERNAYEMNLRAAREIGRQLRLRDLGGVIVNDFIDMRDERHRRGVERALRDAIRRDRARTKILRMSQFGLIEMTRQRIRPSLKRSIYEDCPNCLAQGVVKTPESMSIDVMRILAMAANRQDIRRINITCSQNVANFLNNRKRQDLARIERDSHLTIHIRPEADVAAEFLQVDGFGNYNTEIRLYPTQAMVSHRRVPNTTGVGPSSGQHHSHGHSHSRGHDHGHGQSR
jgi:ribonuclease E